MEKRNFETRSSPLLPRRYIIGILMFLASMMSHAQRLNLSFALVDMVNDTKTSGNLINNTECLNMRNETNKADKKNAEFDWDSELQGLILSAAYIGFCITQLPGGLLCERLGVKNLMLINIITGSICNLISPIAARTDPYLLFTVHLIKGLGQGLPTAALSVVSARWFPKPEKGFLSAFIMSGFSVGGFVSSAVSGALCELELDGGWPLAFYVVGLFQVFITILLIIYYVENPENDPNITQRELEYILENTNPMAPTERPPTPWFAILTSPPTFILIIAMFGQYWMMFYLLTVHPLFMDTILNIPVKENGLLTAGPQFAQVVASLLACWFSFWINKNDASKINLARKGCNSFAVIMFLAGLGGIYLSGCDVTWNEIFLFFTTAAPAFTFGGCLIVAVDMTPTYCGPLMGVASTIASLSGFIIPIVTGQLTKYEQTMVQWHKLFLINAAMAAMNGLVFLIWGSTDIQPYDPAYKKEKISLSNQEVDGLEVSTTHL